MTGRPKLDLKGISLAVLGGDDRELILIPELLRLGAAVNVAGFPPREELKGACLVNEVADAIEKVKAIILPLPGTDDKGNIRAIYAPKKLVLTEQDVARISPETPIFIGVAKPFLRNWAKKYGLKLKEIIEIDHLAILNSIPTAEGAIQLAMQELPITIHGSSCFVLGFGRVGQTLAHKLHALGALTTIVARKEKDLARGSELGYSVCNFTELTTEFTRADVLFNTVPAMILNKEVLGHVSPGTIIIDLASAPGGTDFQYAEKVGIKAIFAPGLPGKVAPVTAGKILSQVIPKLIVQNLAIS